MRNPPLSSMTMPTKHEVHRMRFVEVVQHVGCVSQQDHKTIWYPRRDATKICPVQGRIVHPHDAQLTRPNWHKS